MVSEPAQSSPAIRYAILSAVVMSALVGFSLIWNFNNLEDQAVNLATSEAIANWNKDLSFRQWATRHGGLYVKPDERTPPNPYLSHVPDRDVVTRDGTELTLMNPAYMMRQMTEEYEEAYGIKGKITGQVLLNPINKADPWEMRALKLFDQGVKEIVEQAVVDGAPFLRLMRPMIMKEGCVKCHGHLGFKVGDIRGGVSVSIPLAPYFAAEAGSRQSLMISHGGVWFSGLFIIGFIARRSRKQEDERIRARTALRKAHDELEKRVEERTEELSEQLAERVRVEKALGESEERFRVAFENAPVGVALITLEGNRFKVNKALADFLGYSVEELMDTSMKSTSADLGDLGKSLRLRQQVLDGEIETYRNERRYRHKQGHVVWGEVSGSLFRNEDGEPEHFIAHTIDITERHRAEQALIEAKQNAEEANRVKSEFLANMSHELRTPLNAIIGFSDLIRYKVLGSKNIDKYLTYADDINQSGQHLLDLINDILDLSVIEAEKLELNTEQVGLATLAKVAEQFLSQKANDEGVRIVNTIGMDTPLIMADKRRVKQILINLLSNAVKFTPRDGTVTISAGLEADGCMAVIIADTGVGMDEEGIAKALEPFGQAESMLSRKHEGTGLGLPVTKSLMDAHGGNIEINSKPDKGATITVRFPAERVIADPGS